MQISKDPFQRKIVSVSFKHQSISKDHLLKQVQAQDKGYRSQQTKYEVWWCSDGLNPSTSWFLLKFECLICLSEFTW